MIRRLLFQLTKIVGLLVLPFLALIRTAAFLYNSYGWLPWAAILGGVLASGFLVFVYLVYIQAWIRGALGNLRSMSRTYWLATALVPQLLYTACSPVIGTARTAIAGSVELPVMFAIGWLAFDETLRPVQIVACAMVLGAILLTPARQPRSIAAERERR